MGVGLVWGIGFIFNYCLDLLCFSIFVVILANNTENQTVDKKKIGMKFELFLRN